MTRTTRRLLHRADRISKQIAKNIKLIEAETRALCALECRLKRGRREKTLYLVQEAP
jgi:hypothetical protein